MDTDKLGGGLVNLVLGALILWVGQTTFRHAGMLAGIDQKYESVVGHHDNLRDRLDDHITQLNERTRSRFTREDGDKLRQQLEEVILLVDDTERRLADRVIALQMKVIALETHGQGRTELARINDELQQIRRHGPVALPVERVGVATAAPSYLPAAHTRR